MQGEVSKRLYDDVRCEPAVYFCCWVFVGKGGFAACVGERRVVHKLWPFQAFAAYTDNCKLSR